MCFDCLDHGPVTFADLRCGICRLWSTHRFLSATAMYGPSSDARRDAVYLSQREAQGQADTVAIGPPQIPVPAPVAAPPLGAAADQLAQAIRSVLAGMGFPPQGPFVSGAAPLVGAGVPSGAAPLVGAGTGSKKGGARSGAKKATKRSSSSAAKSSVPSLPTPAIVSEPVPTGLGSTVEASASTSVPLAPKRRRKGKSKSLSSAHVSADDRPSFFDTDPSLACPRVDSDSTSLADLDMYTGFEDGGHSTESAPSEFDASVSYFGRPDRSDDRSTVAFDRGFAHPRACLDRGDKPSRSERTCPRPANTGASRRVDAPRMQAPLSVEVLRSYDRAPIEPLFDQSTVEGDDRPLSSDDEEAVDRGEGSNFRWALEAIAGRMDLLPESPTPVQGSGRFARAPQRQPIVLPVAPRLLESFERINRGVTTKREVGRAEATFPSWRSSAAALQTYRSAVSSGLQTATPVDDPHITGLAHRANHVWSAPMKKARLRSWQSMAHQSLGQLSTADHLVTLSQELLDETDMDDGDRRPLQVTLEILSNVLAGAQRLGATLGAHLDLTVREAELRSLDVTQVDESELRAKPLFEGHTFANVPLAEVSAMRQNRRDDALIKVATRAAPRAPAKKAQPPKQASGKSQKSTSSGSQQPFRQPPPPKGGGKRGGRGRFQKKSK